MVYKFQLKVNGREQAHKVGGVIASVGQRLLDGAARMVVGQFFKNLSQRVGEHSAQE